VTILAHIAVYPAPKKPYKIAKMTNGASERATAQMLNVAVAATDKDTRISAFNETFLSERYPKVNWPKTCETLINARSNAPFGPLSPIDEA
jgi:hypothetical protein